MSLDLPFGSYSAEEGLQLNWLDGYSLEVRVLGGEVVISANPEGLRSLAAHLLTLAREEVPRGVHAHMEPGLELDDGSAPLIVDRT